MKKVSALLLALVLILSLAACGENAAPESEDKTGSVQEESDSGITQGITMEETVIYDENDIKITALGVYETENSFGVTLKLENHSDQQASFYVSHCLLNGFQVLGYYGDLNAEAGGEDLTSIVFNLDDIDFSGRKYWGMDEIATISGAGAKLTVGEKKIPVPFTLFTSAYTGNEVSFDNSGKKVYEKDGITVIYKETVEMEIGDALAFLVLNDTGKDFSVDSVDTYVNGKEFGFSMWGYVYQDAIECRYIVLEPSSLKEYEIGAVENMRFKLCFTDAETNRVFAKSDDIEIELS